ncbi:hypothetical protein B7463_g701, partial [Scytalidium lignicola]
MRVLLLGATGNLGTRVIPALLAHRHILFIYVRNIPKLRTLIPPSILSNATIIQGDATDSDGIKKALLENECDAIVDCAGNQVLPWKEYLLPKIVRAVADAAIEVGKERGGKPLRAWFIGGIGSLGYPGSGGRLIEDYIPRLAGAQHRATFEVLESISSDDLKWSLLCVSIMKPESPQIKPLSSPRNHNLLIGTDMPPGWQDHWVRYIPFIGAILNLGVEVIRGYKAYYEDVADFMAEDLESESMPLVGQRVGYKDKRKIKSHVE